MVDSDLFQEMALARAALAQGSPPLEEIASRTDPGARRYDLFGTANFFNFHPWRVALEYLLEQGIAQIADANATRITRLYEGLDRNRYRVLAPADPGGRSTLLFVEPRGGRDAVAVHTRLREAGVDVALRAGHLRLAPHLHNSSADIDRALDALNGD